MTLSTPQLLLISLLYLLQQHSNSCFSLIPQLMLSHTLLPPPVQLQPPLLLLVLVLLVLMLVLLLPPPPSLKLPALLQMLNGRRCGGGGALRNKCTARLQLQLHDKQSRLGCCVASPFVASGHRTAKHERSSFIMHAGQCACSNKAVHHVCHTLPPSSLAAASQKCAGGGASEPCVRPHVK